MNGFGHFIYTYRGNFTVYFFLKITFISATLWYINIEIKAVSICNKCKNICFCYRK